MRKLLTIASFLMPAFFINHAFCQEQERVHIPFATTEENDGGKKLVYKKLYYVNHEEDALTLHPLYSYLVPNQSNKSATSKKGLSSNEETYTEFKIQTMDLEEGILTFKKISFLHLEYINRLRKGDTLQNLVIEELDLKQIAQKRGDNYFIDFPLYFKNCIIYKVTTDKKAADVQNATRPVKGELFFDKPVSFENCYFDSTTIFQKATFNNSLSLLDIESIDSVIFRDCVVKGDLMIEDNMEEICYHDYVFGKSNPTGYITNSFDFFFEQKAVHFENTFFQRDAYILKWSYYLPLTFEKCTFSGSTHLSPYRSDFSSGKFGTSVNFRHPHQRNDFPRATVAGTYFFSCNFNSTLNLENTYTDTYECFEPTFRDSVILFDTGTPDSVFFRNPRFLNTKGKNIIVVTPNAFKLKDLDCKNYSAKQIYLPFINTDTTHNPELFRQAYNDFYLNMHQEAKAMFEGKTEVQQELMARFENERNHYETKYHWQASNYGSFLLNSSIETIVNHGYHGEMNALITTLIVMVFFALIYLLFFPKQVEQFLLKDAAPQEVAAAPNTKRSFLVRFQDTLYSFSKCFWVSFNIFMTPKYTNSYFKLDKRLFWLFTIEWMIGLFIIIVYLIFIASKYTFVKALIGF